MADPDYRLAVASHVALLLRAERESRDLSMTTVGERAGLSQQIVSYIERGMRNPTLDTLLRITEALGISLSDVLNRAERTALRYKAKKRA
jgi:transcriptional regulator with XRE-family HTH domain